jgi:hypothetical protein
MPSVRRTRLPASASRSVRRPSEMLSLPRSKPCGQRQHFGLERRLHSESTGWVSFYALLVSTLVPAGVQACSIEKNGIDDARMLGCFTIYDLLVSTCSAHHDLSTTSVLKIMCAVWLITRALFVTSHLCH